MDFFSLGFTDRHEIVHGGSATSRTDFIPLWGSVAPGMAEFLAST